MTVRLIDAGRFMLRPLEDEDAPAFAQAVRESAKEISRWMGWAHAAYSTGEALAWIAACRRERVAGTAHEFGVFDPTDGALVGGAGLNRIDPLHAVANLGYWTRTSRVRDGAALAAARSLARHGFEVLQMQRVEVVTAEGNDASAGLARRLGARHECLARHRLRVGGSPVSANVFSLVPGDL